MVITTIGPAKPQRILTSNNNSTVTSAEHLDSERCHLLATNCATTTSNVAGPGSPKAATLPHKLCLETSFTSLQSPSSDVHHNPSLNSSTCSQNVYNASSNNGRIFTKNTNNGHPHITSPFALHPVLSWEYASLLEEQLLASFQNSNNVGSTSGINSGPFSSNIFGANTSGHTDSQKTMKVDLIHDDWFGLAPLATPESLSEVSSISSRASSLMLNIDRTLKDMFGHHRGCLPACRLVDGGSALSPSSIHAGVSFLNSKSPRFLRRTSNGVSGLVNINSRVLKFDTGSSKHTHSSSGDEDLSFESAQQHISSDDGNSTPDNGNNSNSEVFVSVKGTPFSSADSMTVNVDVHNDEKVVYRAVQPSFSPLDTSVVIVSSSPKQVKFLTPQNSTNSEDTPPEDQDTMLVLSKHSVADESRTFRSNDASSNLDGMMVLHLGRASSCEDDYKHKICGDREKVSEVVKKNMMLIGDSIDALRPSYSSAETSPVTDDNSFCSSSTGNNNIRDFKLPSATKNVDASTECSADFGSKRNHDMGTNQLESLPLLSNIGEVRDKAAYARKKYVYSITSVGKGESSV